jgi:hypothetical protein
MSALISRGNNHLKERFIANVSLYKQQKSFTFLPEFLVIFLLKLFKLRSYPCSCLLDQS